ncbi:MAG: hypothetical protein ACRD1K_14330 [Acidimicrobiales bacterium]
MILAVALAVARITGRPVADPSAVDSDPGVVHVHGLGENPADGNLVAATHTGLFRISPTGSATRVADRYQDTMGFTVIGADRFLASGHPDLLDASLQVEGKPPLLGLIESTDAGRSWQPVSLLGDVDFHALVVAHGLVYGLDSTGGQLLVSSDRRQWETRSPLTALDLAVNPTDPDLILATADRAC